MDFTTKAARTEAYLNESAFNRLIKQGDSRRLCGAIEEYIGKKSESYTREEYFIAAAELCGEIFFIDQSRPWQLSEFIEELLGKLKNRVYAPELSVFDNRKGMDLARRLAELKLKADSEKITGCIYYAYKEGKIDLTEQLGLLSFLPMELAAALFLLTVA